MYNSISFRFIKCEWDFSRVYKVIKDEKMHIAQYFELRLINFSKLSQRSWIILKHRSYWMKQTKYLHIGCGVSINTKEENIICKQLEKFSSISKMSRLKNVSNKFFFYTRICIEKIGLNIITDAKGFILNIFLILYAHKIFTIYTL